VQYSTFGVLGVICLLAKYHHPYIL